MRGLVARHAPREHIYLNAVVTDGAATVACRYTTDAPGEADSLYLNRGRRYVCEDGACRMLDPVALSAVMTTGGADPRKTEVNGSALMVSSEPLSGDTGWQPVPVNHLLRVEPNLATATEPVAT